LFLWVEASEFLPSLCGSRFTTLNLLTHARQRSPEHQRTLLLLNHIAAMGALRSLRRTNPITLVIGLLLCIFIFSFLLSPSGQDVASSKLRKASAASNPLSPPTSPFRKPNANSNDGKRIPPPVVHYYMNNVTSTADPVANRERILILTPLARFYQEYWDNVLGLDYPHELITLAFIIPSGKDGNAATAALQEQISKTQSGPEKQRFGSIIIERQDFDPPIASQDEHERHKLENQKARRAAMAQARNSLLFTTLGPSTSWVLWLDSDIVETPPTLIQDLASHDKPIIVPNCFQRYRDTKTNQMQERPYDFNSWQDSQTAQKLAESMGPDDILLEGYADMATYRSLMAYQHSATGDKHAEVPLDGVGGTALMVKAEVHRDGAMFPPFAFYHLIETEGFAKMAKRLGWSATGLPNYKVCHSEDEHCLPKLTENPGVPLQRIRRSGTVFISSFSWPLLTSLPTAIFTASRIFRMELESAWHMW
jgi:mannan polymerase complexes MNN9 subunit